MRHNFRDPHGNIVHRCSVEVLFVMGSRAVGANHIRSVQREEQTVAKYSETNGRRYPTNGNSHDILLSPCRESRSSRFLDG